MKMVKELKIEQAIQQKQFKSEFHKAQINVLYTAAWLNQQATQALKPYNISVQQFNILRILRGMRSQPATVKLLTERMIDKMSNASRLVEKLYQKGLVERRSCASDRRRVDILITQAGLDLVAEASDALEAATLEQMHHLKDDEAEILNLFLDRIRSKE